MKHSKIYQQVLCFLLLGFLLTNTSFSQEKTVFKYTVKIDYGSERSSRDTIITANRQLTALEALQYAAVVESHPVAGYVFVTSIDNVKGQRGVMAWYYQVNSQPSKTLAINNVLKDGDSICWTYKKDVCSGKVDKQCKQ